MERYDFQCRLLDGKQHYVADSCCRPAAEKACGSARHSASEIIKCASPPSSHTVDDQPERCRPCYSIFVACSSYSRHVLSIPVYPCKGLESLLLWVGWFGVPHQGRSLPGLYRDSDRKRNYKAKLTHGSCPANYDSNVCRACQLIFALILKTMG